MTNLSTPELEVIHQEWVKTLDSIRDPLFVVDTQRRVVRMNVALANLCACTITAAIGEPLFVLLPWLKHQADSVCIASRAASTEYYQAPDDRIFSRREFPFDDGRHCLVILEDVSAEVALATAAEKTQADIRASLIEAIGCIGEALRVKDPYTASHSRRVAKLARKIAENMDMSEHESEGIYLGALLHDIGKLYVPSDILNRPGRLSTEEIALIRTHAKVGADILKELEFPWPIHDIVLHHHERLDSSGYPGNLAAKHLCASVRIVSVADTVDAMASNRPYRASLGVSAAIDVLEEGSGHLFDAEVVRTCVAMLKNGEAKANNALLAFDVAR